MKEEITQQMLNIVLFFERLIAKQKDEKMIDLAVYLNEMEKKANQMAEPSAYAEGYKDAIDEAKQITGIKNTVYELYQNPPLKKN